VVISRISDLFLDFVRRELSLIRRSRRKIDYCNLTMDENLHEEALIMRKKFQNLILDVSVVLLKDVKMKSKFKNVTGFARAPSFGV